MFPAYKHHLETYGPDLVYDDFIPLFTASKFNASAWVELFVSASSPPTTGVPPTWDRRTERGIIKSGGSTLIVEYVLETCTGPARRDRGLGLAARSSR